MTVFSYCNRPKKNFIIGICSVGAQYHKKTKKLIEQISEAIEVQFLVLTDEPSQFTELSNVKIKHYEYKSVPYLKQIFSFHDKRLIFEEGFKYSNTVLLLDADHCLRNDSKKKLAEFDPEKLENGAYPQVIWKHPADCSIEHFLDGLTPRVPYGKDFKDYCSKQNYNLDGALLIQESFLFIKETPEKISKFIETWKDLQMFCEKKDIEREQHILGYGEGYSIGVSLNVSGIEIKENPPMVGLLMSAFKHFAWEPE